MNYAIEFEQEDDGRWIAEIPALPGVMAYGASRTDAECKVEAMALRVIADRMERENSTMTGVHFATASVSGRARKRDACTVRCCVSDGWNII